MIIFIELILHKPKAYRHLLYNVVNQETVDVHVIQLHENLRIKQAYNNVDGSTVNLIFRGFHNLAASFVETAPSLSSDTYRSLLLQRNNDVSSVSSFFLASLKVLVNVLSANFAFVVSFALAAKIMLVNSVSPSRRKEILLGMLISSYVKIFLFAMPVWEIPVSVIFIVDMLILSSNAVTLIVITESTTTRCLAACFMAHSVRFSADYVSGSRSLKHLGSVMYLPSLLKNL